jgi:hypothetical protein
MNMINNSEWLWHGALHAKAVVDDEGTIHLTMTGGYDPTDPATRIGDTWTWLGDQESFLLDWVFVKELEPDVVEVPLTTTWLLVVKFPDGSIDYHADFFTTREEALQAFQAEPDCVITGEPCELIDVMEVSYYG